MSGFLDASLASGSTFGRTVPVSVMGSWGSVVRQLWAVCLGKTEVSMPSNRTVFPEPEHAELGPDQRGFTAVRFVNTHSPVGGHLSQSGRICRPSVRA